MMVPEVVVVGAVRAFCGAFPGIGGAASGGFFPAVGTPGGGGLVVFVAGDAFLCLVGQATHSTPVGVLASCLEVIEPLAPVTPYRLTLIRAQGICIPAAEIYLGRRPPHAHK